MWAWALYEHLCGHCNLNLSRYCKVKLLLCVFSLWCGSRAGSWWPWPVIRIGSFMPTWHSSHPSLFSSSSSAGVFNLCNLCIYYHNSQKFSLSLSLPLILLAHDYFHRHCLPHHHSHWKRMIHIALAGLWVWQLMQGLMALQTYLTILIER